jgi:hypothetical protein
MTMTRSLLGNRRFVWCSCDHLVVGFTKHQLKIDMNASFLPWRVDYKAIGSGRAESIALVGFCGVN